MAVTNRNLKRRTFVKAGAAAAAAAAAASFLGCSSQAADKPADSAKTAEETVAEAEEETPAEEAEQRVAHVVASDAPVIDGTGEWKTAACWHNCGGRCLNKVLVQDGVVIRQKTDDTHDDSADYPQQRGCLRGRSQRKQVYAVDRLKYPMKRVNWSPDQPNGDLRGQDEWERISWDEAYGYIATGLKDAKEKYGNNSILLFAGWQGEMKRTLGAFGGFASFWDTNSYGSWAKTPFLIGFHHDNFQDQTINDRFDLRNAETIVMFSMNPAWSAAGSQMLNYYQAKEAGAKFIVIDPMMSETCSALDAEWIPIHPTTDMALMFGIAYAMLDQDDAEGLIDWDFLNRCTVGFDADHMPDDAKEDTNFRDYVMGKYDKVPKTPEWAEKITGVAADRIRQLASELGKDHKVALLCSTGGARTNDTDNHAQLFMTLGAMGGHLGKSGHMTGSTMHVTSGNGGPALIKAGKDGLEDVGNPVDDHINGNEVWDAILTGSYTNTGTGHYDKGEKRDIDIHVIYHSSGNKLQTNIGMARGIEAHRKVDLVIAQTQFYTTAARYADIVLPVTTEWENHDKFIGGKLAHQSNREMMVAYQNICEPLFEAKSDQTIARELAVALGLAEEDVFAISEDQQYFNLVSSMEVMDDDGKTYVPAVGITADDIAEMGAEGEPQEGKLSYQEMKELGVYQVKRQPGDNFGYIAFEDFAKDPEANPLDTPSGKLEIYCQTLADTYTAMGWSTVTPIPTYKPVTNGYEATFADFEAGKKGDYPFQVMNPHYLRRAHTAFDNVPWLREAWTNPVFMSAQDAADLGIQADDTVLLTSPAGQCIRRACVLEGMIPGTLGLPHGAWVAVEEETAIDQVGADNYLLSPAPNGEGTSGYNSCICNIQKYDGAELGADVDEPARLPLKDGE